MTRRFLPGLAAAALALLPASCTPSSGTPTKYVLTVEGINCTTSPASFSVDPGVSTAISASAISPWVWPPSGGWTVVSGAAAISNPDSSSTTVTLNSGDATIRATAADPPGQYVLTVQAIWCTTNPSGSVAVSSGVPESISATASPGYTWTGPAGWTVVSGSASIASPSSSATTVTLSSGDAAIRATAY